MPDDKRIFGLKPNVFFLGLVSFFNDLSNEMILSVFPAFFKSVLKSGAASLGFVEGVADAFSSFTKIFSGRLSDSIQKRKMLAVIGYGVSVATRPFYVFIGRTFDVLSLRVLDRVGKGLRESPRDALLSLSSPQDEMGKSFGYHRALDSLGGVLGPLVAFLILKYFPGNFNAVFTTAFLVGVLAIFSFVFVTEVTGIFVNKKKISFGRVSKDFYYFIAAIFILSAGTLPTAILLLRALDLGYGLETIPLFYLVYNISYTICSILAGKLSDRLGDRPVILMGYLLLFTGYNLLINTNILLTLGISFLILGAFSAFTDGIGRAYTARLTDPSERGTAYGYLHGATGFGALLAGIGGGYTWQTFGAGPTLLASSCIVVVGLIILLYDGFTRTKVDA